jgi:Arc/MetJ-type ribon-helix-helix transcriptional regulator
MMQTINISLPKNLFEEIRLQTKEGTYASVSEFFREAARHLLRLSNNNFTPEAESEILQISAGSVKKDLVFDNSKTPVKDIFKKINKAKI